MVNAPALAVAIAVPLVGGVLGGVSTRGSIDGWYKRINRPSWNPPNKIFPIVWPLLYVSMGVASYLVWEKGGFEAQARALALYAGQLALNFLWTPLFFKWNRLDLASADIVGAMRMAGSSGRGGRGGGKEEGGGGEGVRGGREPAPRAPRSQRNAPNTQPNVPHTLYVNTHTMHTPTTAALWVLIAATIRAFRPVIGDAALWLLGPYLAWVTFATTLTVWIWRHNPAPKQRVRTRRRGE